MKQLLILFAAVAISFSSCNEDDNLPTPGGGGNGGGGGGNGGGSEYTGVWVRLPGPSGDRTDLAIGNIPGESSDRVYMCEKKGSLTPGFFKGRISGSTITFDEVHNLPTYTVGMEDGELLLKANVEWSIATPYEKGSWGGDCGPLEAGGGNNNGGDKQGEVLFWTRKDHGCGSITVTISGKTQTIGSYYSSGAPSCGASGCATFTLPVGTYSFSAECGNYTWGTSSIKITENGCFKMELN